MKMKLPLRLPAEIADRVEEIVQDMSTEERQGLLAAHRAQDSSSWVDVGEPIEGLQVRSFAGAPIAPTSVLIARLIERGARRPLPRVRRGGKRVVTLYLDREQLDQLQQRAGEVTPAETQPGRKPGLSFVALCALAAGLESIS